ncbi:MAG: urease accessory protein UreD [Pseudomonadota bacterium]
MTLPRVGWLAASKAHRGSAPRYQRADGAIDLVVGADGARPRLERARHEGAAKLRFPLARPGCIEAMILNTAGGLAGGDAFSLSAEVRDHTLVTSTQASERVYRSEGGPAVVRQELRVAACAALCHLPQPTILFDEARLVRTTRLEVAAGAELTFCEGFVLGRAAMGETVSKVEVSDRTEVFLGGALAFVDAMQLGAEGLSRASAPAVLGGMRAFAIVLHHTPHKGRMADALDRVRGLIAAPSGASLVGGLLVVRLLAPAHSALQDSAARVTSALTGAPPPRAWQL